MNFEKCTRVPIPNTFRCTWLIQVHFSDELTPHYTPTIWDSELYARHTNWSLVNCSALVTRLCWENTCKIASEKELLSEVGCSSCISNELCRIPAEHVLKVSNRWHLHTRHGEAISSIHARSTWLAFNHTVSNIQMADLFCHGHPTHVSGSVSHHAWPTHERHIPLSKTLVPFQPLQIFQHPKWWSSFINK